MPLRTILQHNIEGESNDAPKLFTNIDDEDFSCTWEQVGNNITYLIKVGETVTHPKYLVNFLSYHLAKKMVKRRLRKEYAEIHPNEDIRKAIFSTRNEEMEIKLQTQMLLQNPEVEKPVEPEKPAVKEPPIEPPKEPETPKEPEPSKEPEKKAEGVQCPHCEFEAKTNFGLRSHIRNKHK